MDIKALTIKTKDGHLWTGNVICYMSHRYVMHNLVYNVTRTILRMHRQFASVRKQKSWSSQCSLLHWSRYEM